MKKNKLVITIILIAIFLSACSDSTVYHKFKYSFFNTFDTIIDITVYTASEKDADKYFEYAEKRFHELHKYYDKYNEYENINNVKTINKNAGIKPVKVEKDLFDLIELSIKYYNDYSDETDISMGKVLNIWSDWRDEVEDGEIPADSKHLPTKEILKEADRFTGIKNLVLNKKDSTIFINNNDTQIDLGAIAKGYATEIIANELVDMGLESGIISAGGNVKIIGKPLDNMRQKWGVAIRNPKKANYDENPDIPDFVDIVFANDTCVVTSGDYQRYIDIDGRRFHHLIDKDTLWPGDYFSSVSIIHPDSGFADFMSTAIFLMPYEEGRKLVESYDDLEALWVFEDDNIEFTDGLKTLLKSQGASGGK
ncbi:MAG: FAD:protein FMN transferase [Tissierellia bacterium]|nr:FAD:protein FMN transferase [Tissierellia bacterium]